MKKIFVLSGVSGSGKTTLAKEFIKQHPEFHLVCSYTTRKPRPEEINGLDYHFISESEFLEKLKKKEFLETDYHFNAYYGTPINDFYNEENLIVVLDVNGALTIKKMFPKETTTIMISTVNIERLKKRGEIDPTELESRVKRIAYETSKMKEFDFIINNDDFIENTVLQLNAILNEVQ